MQMASLALQLIGVVATPCLIVSNKYVLGNKASPIEAMALTLMHNTVSAIAVRTCRICEEPSRRQVTVLRTITICMLGALQIGLSNLLLQLTSVTFHQLSKLATIPLAAAFEFVLKGKQQSALRCAGLLILCSAVYTASSGDLTVTPIACLLGIIWAFLSVAVSTFIYDTCHQYECSSAELMRQLSFWCVVSAGVQLAVVCAFNTSSTVRLDTDSIAAIPFRSTELSVLVFNAGLAFSVQYLSTWAQGNLNPVAYAILGQAKTAMTVLFSACWFQMALSTQTIGGFSICLFVAASLSVSESARWEFAESSSFRCLLILCLSSFALLSTFCLSFHAPVAPEKQWLSSTAPSAPPQVKGLSSSPPPAHQAHTTRLHLNASRQHLSGPPVSTSALAHLNSSRQHLSSPPLFLAASARQALSASRNHLSASPLFSGASASQVVAHPGHTLPLNYSNGSKPYLRDKLGNALLQSGMLSSRRNIYNGATKVENNSLLGRRLRQLGPDALHLSSKLQSVKKELLHRSPEKWDEQQWDNVLAPVLRWLIEESRPEHQVIATAQGLRNYGVMFVSDIHDLASLGFDTFERHMHATGVPSAVCFLLFKKFQADATLDGIQAEEPSSLISSGLVSLNSTSHKGTLESVHNESSTGTQWLSMKILQNITNGVLSSNFSPPLHSRDDGQTFVLAMYVDSWSLFPLALNCILAYRRLHIYNLTVECEPSSLCQAFREFGVITFDVSSMRGQVPTYLLQPVPNWAWGLVMFERVRLSLDFALRGIGTCFLDVDAIPTNSRWLNSRFDIVTSMKDRPAHHSKCRSPSFDKVCLHGYYKYFLVNPGVSCTASNQRMIPWWNHFANAVLRFRDAHYFGYAQWAYINALQEGDFQLQGRANCSNNDPEAKCDFVVKLNRWNQSLMLLAPSRIAHPAGCLGHEQLQSYTTGNLSQVRPEELSKVRAMCKIMLLKKSRAWHLNQPDTDVPLEIWTNFSEASWKTSLTDAAHQKIKALFKHPN